MIRLTMYDGEWVDVDSDTAELVAASRPIVLFTARLTAAELLLGTGGLPDPAAELAFLLADAMPATADFEDHVQPTPEDLDETAGPIRF